MNFWIEAVCIGTIIGILLALVCGWFGAAMFNAGYRRGLEEERIV